MACDLLSHLLVAAASALLVFTWYVMLCKGYGCSIKCNLHACKTCMELFGRGQLVHNGDQICLTCAALLQLGLNSVISANTTYYMIWLSREPCSDAVWATDVV